MMVTPAKSKYAEGTHVTPSTTRAEIEKTLKRFGATGFAYASEGCHAMVAFLMKGRHYRMKLTYPERETLRYTRNHQRRTDIQLEAIYDREVRRLWRGLLLLVKAKLTAAQDGIVSLEDEFLGNTVLPNDQTVSEWASPQITELVEQGKMPPMLPGVQETHPWRRQISGPAQQQDYIDGEIV